jgi:LysW-gamma-L-lysine/LysW-L-ornithine aminotransferase
MSGTSVSIGNIIIPSDSEAIMTLEGQYSSGVYGKRPLAIVRGKGARLWDAEGKEYIDCVGGHGVVNVGHCNPAVVQAITQQAQTLLTCPEMLHNNVRAALQAKLCQLANMGRVFLTNSGTESVEAAFKFARILTGRTEIIACMRAFHGRTMGSLSATWNKKYREPFMPLIPHISHVPFNNLEKLDQAISDQTAAIILEIVQGEGGVHPVDADFIEGAQRLCRERGALLIIDEVQTGFGRTGKMFAYQHYNIEPDLLCLAKSIAGGIPMGAVLINNRLGPIQSQTHGSTFGGNPIACAAALATIDYIETNHLDTRAAELGEWFVGRLRRIESEQIRVVRGKGLMVGIELKQKVTPYLQALMGENILALPAGLTVMRFLPPLVISKEELEQVAQAVEKVLLVK